MYEIDIAYLIVNTLSQIININLQLLHMVLKLIRMTAIM